MENLDIILSVLIFALAGVIVFLYYGINRIYKERDDALQSIEQQRADNRKNIDDAVKKAQERHKEELTSYDITLQNKDIRLEKQKETIDSLRGKIEEKDKKINAQKSVIHRRDVRIQNLLKKQTPKKATLKPKTTKKGTAQKKK